MVGAAAPMIAALTVRRELAKEAMIATLAVFAMLGHLFKVAAFGLVGFRLEGMALPLALMVPAVMLGTWAGRAVLSRVSERVFLVVFQGMLLVLSGKLIFWDGLYRMLS